MSYKYYTSKVYASNLCNHWSKIKRKTKYLHLTSKTLTRKFDPFYILGDTV